MGIKVCKFGGTSMASGNVILSAANIVKSDAARRFVVVSAPGKRFSGDIKVTERCGKSYTARIMTYKVGNSREKADNLTSAISADECVDLVDHDVS